MAEKIDLGEFMTPDWCRSFLQNKESAKEIATLLHLLISPTSSKSTVCCDFHEKISDVAEQKQFIVRKEGPRLFPASLKMAEAVSNPPSDSNVCFAELIVRLDSLLTLCDDRENESSSNHEPNEDNEEEKMRVKQQLEMDVKKKLTELYLRLKNGGNIHDHSTGTIEEDEEDEAVEDFQGSTFVQEGAVGSVDCVGCSSAEDDNEVCPSPIQPKGKLPSRN